MVLSLTLIGLVLALMAGGILAFAVAMRRTDAETTGNRYYGLPAAQRSALKARIAKRGRRLRPLLYLLGRLPPRLPAVDTDGMWTPQAVTRIETVRAAARFVPDARDVFVATQMKCGTTWMQQVVYQVIMRGRGDFGDAGHGHLYATSPWIEATSGVAMDEAPRLGPEALRLIKTHLPADRCPYSPDAKYVYVTRHPVACFSSTVDFLRLLGGPLAPPRDWLLDWYLSDRMYWRSWPDNVAGWWRWAAERPNVLFVHYEEMLADLSGVVTRVAELLNIPLTAEEHAEVVRKSDFAFMKTHEEQFEMNPPTLLSELGPGSFLQSGKRSRESEGSAEERERIMRFCRERLAGTSYPFERFYPSAPAPGQRPVAGARAVDA